MTSNWYYKNTPITELPLGVVGFVYLITNLTSGRQYVGKKKAKFSKTRYQTVTLKNGTKKKKKIRYQIDSDWLTYWGSSIELNKDIETLSTRAFKREILYMCNTLAECSYLEAKEQFIRAVLESDAYYNNNIQVRVHGSHIRNKI